MGCQWHIAGDEEKLAICYAKTTAERIRDGKSGAYKHGFEHLTFHPKELTAIQRKSQRCGIFIDSMSDMFGQGVKPEWIDQIIDTMHMTPHHVFQVLTKRPQVMFKYAHRLPSNVWLGVSAPPQVMMGKRLTDHQQLKWWANALQGLSALDNPVKWLSVEPLSWNDDSLGHSMVNVFQKHAHGVQWVVLGAGSHNRKTYQPDKRIFARMMEIIRSNEIPVFFKKNISKRLAEQVCGRYYRQFPKPETFNYPI